MKSYVVLDSTSKLGFKTIEPIDKTLKNLTDYINYLEQSKERAYKELENFNKDEKIIELTNEIKMLRKNSIAVMSEKEHKAAKIFIDKHFEKHEKKRGCSCSYIVSGTGIGDVIEIECNVCKERKDITDMDTW